MTRDHFTVCLISELFCWFSILINILYSYSSNNNNGKTKEQIANKYSQPKVSNERYRASYDFNDGGCSWWLNNKNNKNNNNISLSLYFKFKVLLWFLFACLFESTDKCFPTALIMYSILCIYIIVVRY